jgi:hypothetical protein
MWYYWEAFRSPQTSQRISLYAAILPARAGLFRSLFLSLRALSLTLPFGIAKVAFWENSLHKEKRAKLKKKKGITYRANHFLADIIMWHTHLYKILGSIPVYYILLIFESSDSLCGVRSMEGGNCRNVRGGCKAQHINCRLLRQP